MNIKLLLLALTVLIVILIPEFIKTEQGIIKPELLTGAYEQNETKAVFNNKAVTVGSEIAEVKTKSKKVLGVNDSIKRIEVDLAQQRLFAYEGDKLVYNFLISSGKWGKTPTGTFRIWTKLRYTKMEGGNKALRTYYYLPNVPYVMFFENDEIPGYRGFGLHGTYWHSNFGHPMSHGCVNMKTEEAGLLYNWATPNTGDNKSGRATAENPGTEIKIYGVAPSN